MASMFNSKGNNVRSLCSNMCVNSMDLQINLRTQETHFTNRNRQSCQSGGYKRSKEILTNCVELKDMLSIGQVTMIRDKGQTEYKAGHHE